jgi:predicted protein tyrosine phosphatase
MPWIQNVALSDIKKGHHIDPGPNNVLIQIVDTGMEFPEPKYKFNSVHQFQFLDLERDDKCIEPEMKINDHQAESLVIILKQALLNRSNVIVHCVAGVCRSGAVCEVGVMLGFDDTEAFRSPNLLVKHKMMKVLGLTYDENEPHTINGQTTEFGIILPKTVEWTNDNEKVFTLAAERRARREREEGI